MQLTNVHSPDRDSRYVKLTEMEAANQACLSMGDEPFLLKFIYSEKATKFCKTFTLFLTTVHTVKSKVKISQNFVAFSEYMNFT